MNLNDNDLDMIARARQLADLSADAVEQRGAYSVVREAQLVLAHLAAIIEQAR